MPGQDVIVVPDPSQIVFDLAPARTAVQSVLSLLKGGEYGGEFGEWVSRTLDALTLEERQTLKLVTNGLYYLLVPRQDWPSFAAYIDHLASMPAEALRK